jgi:hypothetical protein
MSRMISMAERSVYGYTPHFFSFSFTMELERVGQGDLQRLYGFTVLLGCGNSIFFSPVLRLLYVHVQNCNTHSQHRRSALSTIQCMSYLRAHLASSSYKRLLSAASSVFVQLADVETAEKRARALDTVR